MVGLMTETLASSVVLPDDPAAFSGQPCRHLLRLAFRPTFSKNFPCTRGPAQRNEGEHNGRVTE